MENNSPQTKPKSDSTTILSADSVKLKVKNSRVSLNSMVQDKTVDTHSHHVGWSGKKSSCNFGYSTRPTIHSPHAGLEGQESLTSRPSTHAQAW